MLTVELHCGKNKTTCSDTKRQIEAQCELFRCKLEAYVLPLLFFPPENHVAKKIKNVLNTTGCCLIAWFPFCRNTTTRPHSASCVLWEITHSHTHHRYNQTFRPPWPQIRVSSNQNLERPASVCIKRPVVPSSGFLLIIVCSIYCATSRGVDRQTHTHKRIMGKCQYGANCWTGRTTRSCKTSSFLKQELICVTDLWPLGFPTAISKVVYCYCHTDV